MNRLTHLALALALAGCFDSDTGPTADSETGETETGDGDTGTGETGDATAGDATSGETGGGSGSGDGDGEAGAFVSVCATADEQDCRLVYGGKCPALEIDVCATWSEPRACTELAGLCIMVEPGEPCPAGWSDACEYYE